MECMGADSGRKRCQRASTGERWAQASGLLLIEIV